MKWELPIALGLIAGAWVPIIGTVAYFGGGMMDRAKVEYRASERYQLELDRLKQERRAAFAKRLGFDPENGGRRFGDLVVQELENPETVLLYIPGSIVTIDQVQRIQQILRETVIADRKGPNQ